MKPEDFASALKFFKIKAGEVPTVPVAAVSREQCSFLAKFEKITANVC